MDDPRARDRDRHRRLTPTYTIEEVERIEALADARVDAASDMVVLAFVAGAIMGAILGWLAWGTPLT